MAEDEERDMLEQEDEQMEIPEEERQMSGQERLQETLKWQKWMILLLFCGMILTMAFGFYVEKQYNNLAGECNQKIEQCRNQVAIERSTPIRPKTDYGLPPYLIQNG